ncbi:MAG TPA: hypothetical protein VGX23_25710 [Actinocrinis sp.]|nr:hypothetical protein [Actinocrinis sp.]
MPGTHFMVILSDGEIAEIADAAVSDSAARLTQAAGRPPPRPRPRPRRWPGCSPWPSCAARWTGWPTGPRPGRCAPGPATRSWAGPAT